MTESLKNLKQNAEEELSKAETLEELDALVVKYFGRSNGLLNNVLRNIKNLTESERRSLGSQANEVKIEIWKTVDSMRDKIKTRNKPEFLDFTQHTPMELGHLHPITKIQKQIEQIFRDLGFAVMLGRDIETDYYNFEALNIPSEHPARDMFDTFYIDDPNPKAKDKLVLRTHTSPMQARIMENYKPPFSVIIPGKTFRNEATDARHEHTFYQIEGLVVGEDISLANLKWTLDTLLTKLFGGGIKIQYRPSYFPFTEPSVEVLTSCIFCNQKGCSVCSQTGWLEVLGAGMVHPKVFEYANYPKGKYTGFAFGLGILRLAMLLYNIPDIRMFHQNDQRLLDQF